jgi:putative sterol carrier protein
MEWYLEDAAGPRRLSPRFAKAGSVAAATTQVSTLTDPRVLRRVSLADGRIELAVTTDEGERVAVVFGFGSAARRGIDPDSPEAVVDLRLTTFERVLRGDLAPEDALSEGDVRVRGNRFLALQLAVALAPFSAARR